MFFNSWTITSAFRRHFTAALRITYTTVCLIRCINRRRGWKIPPLEEESNPLNRYSVKLRDTVKHGRKMESKCKNAILTRIRRAHLTNFASLTPRKVDLAAWLGSSKKLTRMWNFKRSFQAGERQDLAIGRLGSGRVRLILNRREVTG